MTRRMQYRGDMRAEWASYGPDTEAIATAFVRGVNAWVDIALDHLPEEFTHAGWRPERWKAEDLLNRTDAFVASSNAVDEVLRARLVAAVGLRRADALLPPPAGAPTVVPRGLDVATISPVIVDALRRVGHAAVFQRSGRAGVDGPWQQRVGRERRTIRDRFAAARDRSASPARPSIRPLSRASERARLERHRRRRTLDARRGHRPQRARRVGDDESRGRRAGRLRRARQSRQPSPGRRPAAGGRTRSSSPIRSSSEPARNRSRSSASTPVTARSSPPIVNGTSRTRFAGRASSPGPPASSPRSVSIARSPSRSCAPRSAAGSCRRRRSSTPRPTGTSDRMRRRGRRCVGHGRARCPVPGWTGEYEWEGTRAGSHAQTGHANATEDADPRTRVCRVGQRQPRQNAPHRTALDGAADVRHR